MNLFKVIMLAALVAEVMAMAIPENDEDVLQMDRVRDDGGDRDRGDDGD